MKPPEPSEAIGSSSRPLWSRPCKEYKKYKLYFSDERNMAHLNQQRRRNLIPYEPRIIDANGNCISEPRPGENGVFVNDTSVSDNYGSLPQHRTIPLPLCVNADQINNRPAAENSTPNSGANSRLYSVYKSKFVITIPKPLER